MFTRLEGDTAVLLIKGVYKQADLYEWNGGLFASAAGGYVRISADGRTSKPDLNVKSLTTDAPLWADRFGRLSLRDGEGFKPIAPTDNPLMITQGD